jgi:hypothetical protein
MMDLEQLLEIFRKYLYLPDTGAVEVTLGAIAANRLPGDPVWLLLLVGPPSSGKTEILSSLSLLPDIHEVSTIMQAGLLSGSAGKGAGVTGGLLAEIGRFGVIACKDFTSILSASPDARTTVMAALREIYDGKWIRHLGTSGGRVVAWKGNVGFVGAVTEVIDLHAATIGTMGERFVFYRLPELDDEERLELGHASMGLTGSQDAMRLELAEEVEGFLAGAKLSPELPELSFDNMRRLVLLADLATKRRSSVERSGRDREIELVPQSEALGRLQSELVQLGRGLTWIGVGPERIDELLAKVALDGMSKNGRAIVDYFVGQGRNLVPTSRDIANQLRLPTPATHRALEDIAAHGVVEKFGSSGAHSWRASEWLMERWASIAFEA